MFFVNFLKIFLTLKCLINIITCSHFYGGMITYKPEKATSTGNVKIIFLYRFYWLLSNYYCDDTSIANKLLIGDTTKIKCQLGCLPSYFEFSSQVICTDYSTINSWSGGSTSTTIEITQSNLVEVSYASNAWITLNSGGGGWEVRLRLNLITRSDTKRINTSPVSSISPIVKLKLGCKHVIKIPAFDADGDQVKCRWAIGNECATVCNAVPGSILDENNCTLTFQSSLTGYYAVAIQIEDYAYKISTTSPLSSVPLQFLILVESFNGDCTAFLNKKLLFHDLTFPDSACLMVEFGKTLKGKIVIYSDKTLVEITTLSPGGLIKSSIKNYNGNSTLWYVDIEWTPTDPTQEGLNLFCFQGKNVDEVTTDQRCVSIVVGYVKKPFFLNPSPIGLVKSNVNEFTISSDRDVQKSFNNSAYIRFYDKNKTELFKLDAGSIHLTILNSSLIKFIVNYTFIEDESYFILFDTNIVSSVDYCGIPSDPITNETFWQFKIIVQPVILTSDVLTTNTLTTTVRTSQIQQQQYNTLQSVNFNFINLILTSFSLLLSACSCCCFCVIFFYLMRRRRRECKVKCLGNQIINVEPKPYEDVKIKQNEILPNPRFIVIKR